MVPTIRHTSIYSNNSSSGYVITPYIGITLFYTLGGDKIFHVAHYVFEADCRFEKTAQFTKFISVAGAPHLPSFTVFTPNDVTSPHHWCPVFLCDIICYIVIHPWRSIQFTLIDVKLCSVRLS
jgi:hypothetical protein